MRRLIATFFLHVFRQEIAFRNRNYIEGPIASARCWRGARGPQGGDPPKGGVLWLASGA